MVKLAFERHTEEDQTLGSDNCTIAEFIRLYPPRAVAHTFTYALEWAFDKTLPAKTRKIIMQIAHGLLTYATRPPIFEQNTFKSCESYNKMVKNAKGHSEEGKENPPKKQKKSSTINVCGSQGSYNSVD